MYQDPNFDKEQYWKQRSAPFKAKQFVRQLAKQANVIKSHPSGVVPHTSNKPVTKKAVLKGAKRHRKELARLEATA
jgi:hypothetical protein